MNKNKLHLLVDVLAYLCMVALASTGLILIYKLPHGSPREGLTLLGLDRHGWGDVHWYLAIGLLSLVALHVVLHWKWVTNTLGALVRSHAARRAGAGAGGTALLLVLGAATAGVVAVPWLIGVQKGDAQSHGGGHGDRGGRGEGKGGGFSESAPTASAGKGHGEGGGHAVDHAIRGQSTLAEAAREAGVPVARLIAELKLPPDTAPDARLGQLRHQHGFEITDVRATLERLKKQDPTQP